MRTKTSPLPNYKTCTAHTSSQTVACTFARISRDSVTKRQYEIPGFGLEKWHVFISFLAEVEKKGSWIFQFPIHRTAVTFTSVFAADSEYRNTNSSTRNDAYACRVIFSKMLLQLTCNRTMCRTVFTSPGTCTWWLRHQTVPSLRNAPFSLRCMQFDRMPYFNNLADMVRCTSVYPSI